MDRIGIFILAAFMLAAFTFGCSSGGENPVFPTGENHAVVESSGTTACFGLWQITIDPATGTGDIVQLRNADKIINVLAFMEPPPLTSMDLDWADMYIDFPNNHIDVGVILKHPIPDDVFTGFDVRGVCFGPVVENADGLTIIPGPEFFSGVPFGYQDGLLGAPDSYGHYEGLAGYKYYCVGLGEDEVLSDFFSDPGNLVDRGKFGAGANIQRNYSLDWDGTGYDILVFNYAIYANYDWPTGEAPWDVDDWDITAANSAEAFCADATETANSLFYDGSSGGGTISLDVEVWDWQGDISFVTIEAGDGAIISETDYDTDSAGATDYSHVYSFTDVGGSPVSTGDLDILITVTDAKTFGECWFLTLLPEANSMFDVPVYNCFLHTTTVGEATPGIYVDGDNNTGTEDGSQANPFNTIMEGIDAAGVGDTIEVDAITSDGEYAEKVTLKSDITLIGSNWNEGVGKPKIRIAGDRANRMDGNGISNTVVDGFDITSDYLNYPWSSGGDNYIQLIYLIDCTDVTIKNCRLHTMVNITVLIGIRVTDGSGITIEHNEFVNLYNVRGYNWSIRTTGLNISGTSGAVVKHNEVHHLNHQYVHDGGDARVTYTDAFRVYNAPSATIANNLIYDIYDYSRGDGGTEYYRHNSIMGIYAVNCTNAVITNNTIDDINCVADTTNDAGAFRGIQCGDLDQVAESYTVKNNIVSNIVTTEYLGIASWVGCGFDSAFTTTVTYSCVYSLDLGYNGAEYYNLAIKGTGSFDNADNEAPAYDMTPGATFYHVTNANLVSDDDSEMGAFGGSDGDWLPPSQE